MEYFNGGFMPNAPSGKKWPHFGAGFLVEFFGSLIFLFVSAGAGAIQPFLSHTDSVLFGLANGFGLMAAIWIASYILGAGHINPVVTITLFFYSFYERYRIYRNKEEFRKLWWFTEFAWNLLYLIVWIGAQLLGAIVASALLLAIFGGGSNLGRPVVGPGFSWERAFGFEIIGSTILIFVYIYLIWRLSEQTLPKERELRFVAIPIGITHLALSSIGAFISSASFNWWRHFGPTFLSNTWNADGDSRNVDWIWYVGPLIGGIIAFGLFVAFWELINITGGVEGGGEELTVNSKQKIYVRTQTNRKSKSKPKPKSKRYDNDGDGNDDVEEYVNDLF